VPYFYLSETVKLLSQYFSASGLVVNLSLKTVYSPTFFVVPCFMVDMKVSLFLFLDSTRKNLDIPDCLKTNSKQRCAIDVK
jgi:hypothetical protein